MFVTDLHGRTDRYEKLFALIENEQPSAVFLGGDLLPFGGGLGGPDDSPAEFIGGFLAPSLKQLQNRLGRNAPRILLILGNDDPRVFEAEVKEYAEEGLWEYMHNQLVELDGRPVFGYACVPPSPFMMKDWERYDVSRYIGPGDVSPEEGYRTMEVPANEAKYRTIADDLDRLAEKADLSEAILLFHAPPHETKLDRVARDGQMIDHVPLDIHVGSIAIRRFIEKQQPLLTLHGHIHESARLTGDWREKIGSTHIFSAAHDGPELCVVRFDPERLDEATRSLY
jgi:Icc-related predicted phosphoesterase